MGLRSIFKILTDKSNPNDYEITSPFPRTEAEKRAAHEKAMSLALPRSPEDRLVTAVEGLETTSYMETFFRCYDEIIECIDQLVDEEGNITPGYNDEVVELAEKYSDDNAWTIATVNFIDRAINTGKGRLLKQELWKYIDRMTQDSIAYAEEQLGSITAPAMFDGDKYLYCLVEFESGGNTYYYISDNHNVTVGNEVVVPVGNYGRTSVAKIVRTEMFEIDECPFPPEKAKRIIKVVK